MSEHSKLRFGVINISDRASAGVYEDTPGKEAVAWLKEVFADEWQLEYAVVPDEERRISDTLIDMADQRGCCLILTTGGTGPSPRDVTPEATMKVCERLLPGFGEAMRAESRKKVPTAILSRQIAGTRGKCLIINLPGRPTAIRECLEVIAAAIPYCIFLVSGVKPTYRPERTQGYQPS
jgi:molybdopterin adenylyltransferase